MLICTRSLARVRPTSREKLLVLLEHFRRNRQDFRKGFAFVFTPSRNRPKTRILPIVPR